MKAIAIVVTILAIPVLAFFYVTNVLVEQGGGTTWEGKMWMLIILALVGGLWWLALRKPTNTASAQNLSIEKKIGIAVLIVAVLTILWQSLSF